MSEQFLGTELGYGETGTVSFNTSPKQRSLIGASFGALAGVGVIVAAGTTLIIGAITIDSWTSNINAATAQTETVTLASRPVAPEEAQAAMNGSAQPR